MRNLWKNIFPNITKECQILGTENHIDVAYVMYSTFYPCYN